MHTFRPLASAILLPLLLCLLGGSIGGEGQQSGGNMALQLRGSLGLEYSSVVARLLLVSTLDGTLYAFDKLSGALLWENRALGEHLITGQYQFSTEETSTEPIYMLEPWRSGFIYAYLPGAAIKRLPFSIKDLVAQSPLRWPDGTFFLGQKNSKFLALDLATGQVVFTFEVGDPLKGACPTEEMLEAFSGDSRDLILLAMAFFSLSAFKSNIPQWSMKYGEVVGLADPLLGDSNEHEAGQQWSIHTRLEEDPRDSQLYYSSFNGIIYTRDRTTKQILWMRQLSSIATSFFKLSEASQLTILKKDQLGPILVPLPIERPALGLSDGDYSSERGDPTTSSTMHITVGRKNGLLFVLPSDIFPLLRQDRSSDQGKRHGLISYQESSLSMILSSPTDALALSTPSSSYYTLEDPIECRPGSSNFPDCLLGPRMAKVLPPIPLLGPSPSREASPLQSSSLYHSLLPYALSLLSVLLGTALLQRWRHRRLRTVIPQPLTRQVSTSSMDVPPGFEEISLTSADLLYSNLNELYDSSAPRSFQLSNEIIGYGSHGTVVLKGIFDGRPVAVKRMLIDFYDVAGHEVNLLQQSDHHPNVIRYFCREKTARFMYIVLELCNGSLSDLVEQVGNGNGGAANLLNELGGPQVILHQAILGLHHLHSLKLVHRDIKPQNILISQQKRIVISDFGLSKRLAEGQSSFNATIQGGTLGWRAPECILSEEASKLAELRTDSAVQPIKITKAIDIFAMGCVFYYVLSMGRHPFGMRTHREANIIQNRHDLSAISQYPEAQDLIALMISRDPGKRPTTAQVLIHPFFWSATKKLQFLQDVSDRLELEDRTQEPSGLLRAYEARRMTIFEGSQSWYRQVDQVFWHDLNLYRKYNSQSAQDLLRAIRNKRSHFHDLSESTRALLGETAETFFGYFSLRFPHLLMETFNFVADTFLKEESPFALRYFADYQKREHITTMYNA